MAAQSGVTFPGTYSSYLQGQQGGQAEMQAHGLSSNAVATANIPGNTTNPTTPSTNTTQQSMLQTPATPSSSANNAPDWSQILNPMSLLSMWQLQYMPQSLQNNGSQQSMFATQNMSPWQASPGQA